MSKKGGTSAIRSPNQSAGQAGTIGLTKMLVIFSAETNESNEILREYHGMYMYLYLYIYMDVGQNGRPRGPQMLV